MQLFLRIGDITIVAHETHSNEKAADEHVMIVTDTWTGESKQHKVNGELEVIRLINQFHKADEEGANDWRAIFPHASP